MLQIIGWLGCLYLAVKGFEFATSNSFKDAEGETYTRALILALISIVGSLAFAVLIFNAGVETEKALNGFGSSNPPIMNIDTSDTQKFIDAYANKIDAEERKRRAR